MRKVGFLKNHSGTSFLYNLAAFKEDRSLALLPKARWDEVMPPTGVDEGLWNRLAVIHKGGLVMVEGKLSDIPSGIKIILDGEESRVELTIASIDIDDQGLLNSDISGTPVMILFNDGTSVQINSGQDPSIGHDAYGNYFPNKGINDISCISFADIGSTSLYILQVIGE